MLDVEVITERMGPLEEPDTRITIIKDGEMIIERNETDDEDDNVEVYDKSIPTSADGFLQSPSSAPVSSQSSPLVVSSSSVVRYQEDNSGIFLEATYAICNLLNGKYFFFNSYNVCIDVEVLI
jgi:hypothetical protein